MSYGELLNNLNSLSEWLDSELRKINKKLDVLIIQERKEMATLDDLTAEVAAQTTVNQSAITLLQGLKAKLDAAGTDPAKLQAIKDSLTANDQALAQAVAQNTPAA
jgi:hypothetical protein